MTALSIPSFSNPINRNDYNTVTNMLTNFFVSQGFNQGDAAAQAGLVLNLKQQGYSDTDINTAVATQQNTLNSISANQAAQAAAALAAEQPKVAATLALSAAAKAAEGKNSLGNTLITVNGVTETRDQAANFADNSVGEMVANPNNPRGPLITRAQYDQIIQRNQESTGSDTSLIATTPNVSQVVAVNGIPVSDNTVKPQLLGTSVPITDPTKTFSQIVSQSNVDLTNSTTNPNTVTNPPPPSSDPFTQLKDYLSNLLSPVTKPASDALTTAEKTISDTVTAAQKTLGDSTNAVLTDAQKTFGDTLAAAEQQAAALAAAGSKTVADSVSAAQKSASDLITNAEASVAGILAKLTSTVSQIPDPTKTYLPPTPNDIPPTTTPPPTDSGNKPDTTPQPPTQTLTEKAMAFFTKYSLPIVLTIGGAGAIGSLLFVMSHNSKQGVIVP